MAYNLFNDLHYPLRAALLKACMLMNKKATGILPETIMAVKETLRIFKIQMKQEGMFILPLVFEYEPAVWDVYTREHHVATNHATALELIVQQLQLANDEGEIAMAEQHLDRAFMDFMTVNYTHMDDEEEVLNEVLWRYYKDDFLQQLKQQVEAAPTIVRAKSAANFEKAKAA